MEAWKNPIGPKITERRENKAALMQPRMGNSHTLVTNGHFAKVKQIKIDRSRRVPRPPWAAPEILFDLLQAPEQLQGRSRVVDFYNRVQEKCRSGRTLDRIRFIDRGRPARSRIICNQADFIPRPLQITETVGGVRAQSDTRFHNTDKLTPRSA